MFWDMVAFYMKLLKAEWEVDQQEGGEEFTCYIIWHKITAVLHSNEQQQTEKNGDREESCHKSALQPKTGNDDDWWLIWNWIFIGRPFHCDQCCSTLLLCWLLNYIISARCIKRYKNLCWCQHLFKSVIVQSVKFKFIEHAAKFLLNLWIINRICCSFCYCKLWAGAFQLAWTVC